jgi:hypothetical protein
MSDPWFVNENPELPIQVTRPGIFHVARRKLEWELLCELGALADYGFDKPRWLHGEVKGAKSTTTADATARSYVNTLAVPNVGGLEFTVKVQKAPDQGTKNVNHVQVFETWRKLYLNVSFMDGECEKLFDTAYAKAKVEYAKAKIELAVLAKAKALGDPETVSIVGTDAVDAGAFPAKHAGDKNAKAPFQANVLLVKDIASRDTAQQKVDQFDGTGGESFVFDREKKTLRIDTGGKVSWIERDFRLKTLEVKGKDIDVSGLVSAIEEADGAKVVFELSLTGTLAPLQEGLAAGEKFTLVAKWDRLVSFGGGSVKNTNFIVLTTKQKPGESAADLEKKVFVALCHELAHALGVVKQRERKRVDRRMDDVRNELHYQLSGNHCSTGAVAAPGSATPTEGQDQCLMFHLYGGKAKMEKFCEVCLGQLKRGKISVKGA